MKFQKKAIMSIFIFANFILFQNASLALVPEKSVATPISISPKSNTTYKFREKIEYQWHRDLSAEKYDIHIYNRRLKKVSYQKNSLDPKSICDEKLCRLKVDLNLPLTESQGHVFRVKAITLKGQSEYSYTPFFIKGTQDQVTTLNLAASKIINLEAWKDQTNDDSVSGYNNWPALEGLSALYKATGEIKYIKASIELSLKYIDSGVKRNSNYLEWQSSWLGGNYGHGHTEWRAAAGIATLVHTIHFDPLLKSQFPTEYNKMLNFLERDIWEKSELTKLMEPNDMLNKMKRVGQVTHFIARVGLVTIPLYQITKKQKYYAWISQNVKIMKDSLFKNPSYPFNCYTNDYNCLVDRKVIDTSHAGDTIAFIHLAYKASFFFNHRDMENLSRHALTTLWNQDLKTIKFYDYLDKQDLLSSSKGWNQGAWTILGTYNPDLRSLYLKWIGQEKGITDRLKLHALGNIALSMYGEN